MTTKKHSVKKTPAKVPSKMNKKEQAAMKRYGRIVYVVDRAKWNRGDLFHETNLLSAERPSKGTMCCLGHCLLQDGAKSSQIEEKALPADVSESFFDGKGKLSPFVILQKLSYNDQGWIYKNTDFSLKAAEINDNADISDKTREERLIKLFASKGLRLSFKGKYVGGELKAARDR